MAVTGGTDAVDQVTAGAVRNTGARPLASWAGPGLLTIVLAIMLIVGMAKGSDATCLFVGVLLVFVVVGELGYSRFLADHIFKLSDDEITPAHDPTKHDDPDHCATPAYILWGHHWTSITGAAPIVGPGMAAYYGWLPALLWIVLGGLFSGAVHDFSCLVVSARNGGRSIADLAGYIVSWRLRVIFLLLVNFLCVLVCAKFMEVIAKLFILWPETVLPIWMEVPLAMVMGLVHRAASKALGVGKGKVAMLVMSLVFLVVLYGFVFAAVKIEEDFGTWESGALVDPVFGFSIGEGREICRDSVNWDRDTNEYHCGFGAMQFWTILLCIYAMVAACLPVWVLLQPRDFINSHQLKVVMAGLTLGLLIKGPTLDAEAIRPSSSFSKSIEDRSPIFPMMFTLVACGATSGFHGLVSSGVTSKQLDKMRDARVIGYSGMLGECTLAALVVITVCSSGEWSTIYATGMSWTGFLSAGGALLEELGFDPRPARTIMNVLVVSFAATTLDSAMRIQRILVGELGKSVERVVPRASVLCKSVTFQVLASAVPSIYIANSRSIAAVWNLFGATNQLTACVSLLVVAVYIMRYRGCRKHELYCVLPFAAPVGFLLVIVTWALIREMRFYIEDCQVIECDWRTTTPIYPTIILAFMIAALAFAVYCEVLVYVFSGKVKRDKPVDDDGKLEFCQPCGGFQGIAEIPGLGCC